MAGKGDRPRHTLGKQWYENYARVFGKKPTPAAEPVDKQAEGKEHKKDKK